MIEATWMIGNTITRPKKMTECTCYMQYPNECHKHKNGKWKCVDNYECIRPLEEIKLAGLPFPRVIRKTKCVKVR